MSEETTMYEELAYWALMIKRLKKLAIEMQSNEQDAGYISDSIVGLFLDIAKLEPDENGINDRYFVDLEHPGNRGRKLVFEFYAYITDEQV